MGNFNYFQHARRQMGRRIIIYYLFIYLFIGLRPTRRPSKRAWGVVYYDARSLWEGRRSLGGCVIAFFRMIVSVCACSLSVLCLCACMRVCFCVCMFMSLSVCGAWVCFLFSFCDQILCEKPACEDRFQILFISCQIQPGASKKLPKWNQKGPTWTPKGPKWSQKGPTLTKRAPKVDQKT